MVADWWSRYFDHITEESKKSRRVGLAVTSWWRGLRRRWECPRWAQGPGARPCIYAAAPCCSRGAATSSVTQTHNSSLEETTSIILDLITELDLVDSWNPTVYISFQSNSILNNQCTFQKVTVFNTT